MRCPAGPAEHAPPRRRLRASPRSRSPAAARTRARPAAGSRPSGAHGADAFYGVTLPAVDGESSRAGETGARSSSARLATEATDGGNPLTLADRSDRWTNLQDAPGPRPRLRRAPGRASTRWAGTIDAPGQHRRTATTSPADDGRVERRRRPGRGGRRPRARTSRSRSSGSTPPTTCPSLRTSSTSSPTDHGGRRRGHRARDVCLRTPFLAGSGNSYWDHARGDHCSRTRRSPAWEDVAGHDAEPSGPRAPAARARDPVWQVRARRDDRGHRCRFMRRLPRPPSGPARRGPSARSRSPARWRSRWDGTACTALDRPKTAGLVEVTLVNTTQRDVALLLGEAAAPKTWADVVTFITHADLAARTSRPRTGSSRCRSTWSASAGTRATAFAPIPAGTVGILCATGTYPDLTFHDGGPITLGGADTSPGHQLPDLGLELAGATADLGEQRDRPVEVIHRLLGAAHRVELVGEIVLDGSLEVRRPVRRAATTAASRRAMATSRSPAAASTSASAFRAAMAGPGSASASRGRGSSAARHVPRRNRLAVGR